MFDRHAWEEQLHRVNELALWDYVSCLEGQTLLVRGSNDFSYSHYLELEFSGVSATDLPSAFSHAQFQLGEVRDGVATVWITAETQRSPVPAQFEIRTTGMTMRIGRVYYYDRENLQPGERVAICERSGE